MHKTRQIFEAFYNALKALESNALIAQVVKTNIDSVAQFPTVSVSLGDDSRDEFTKESNEFRLTLYTDLYIREIEKNIDTSMLDVRELIEQTIYDSDLLGLDYIFEIDFISQSQPSYNGEGLEYSSETRLEWQIRYFREHKNPSV